MMELKIADAAEEYMNSDIHEAIIDTSTKFQEALWSRIYHEVQSYIANYTDDNFLDLENQPITVCQPHLNEKRIFYNGEHILTVKISYECDDGDAKIKGGIEREYRGDDNE